MGELLLRFVIGGVVVSLFSVVGDLFRPKNFAGIFGAAPSVALATLGLAFLNEGGARAAIEGRSMLAGAVAFFVYNLVVTRLLMGRKCSAWVAAAGCWAVWLVVAFGLWALWLR